MWVFMISDIQTIKIYQFKILVRNNLRKICHQKFWYTGQERQVYLEGTHCLINDSMAKF